MWGGIAGKMQSGVICAYWHHAWSFLFLLRACIFFIPDYPAWPRCQDFPIDSTLARRLAGSQPSPSSHGVLCLELWAQTFYCLGKPICLTSPTLHLQPLLVPKRHRSSLLIFTPHYQDLGTWERATLKPEDVTPVMMWCDLQIYPKTRHQERSWSTVQGF